MEVKPGYKQTEVGVIPEEWDVSTFSGLFDVTAGGDVDPKRSASDQDETHCYPIYSNALTSRGLYGYCSYADHQAGSITITGRGTLGSANFRDHPYTAIGRVLVLQPKNELAGRFFVEVINHRVRFAIESTGVPQLTAPQISTYRLPVPPLPEQRAIAAALSDVDALIGALDQLIAKKRDLKQAAMQQLLTGQTRLPGFHGEWQEKRLGELFEITSSKRVFQREWKSEGIPFYRARELVVLGEKGCVDNELFISSVLYDAFRNAHGVPQVGDMLVTGVGTLGKAFVVTDDRQFYFKDGNIIWFKIWGRMSSEFLRQLYLTKMVINQISEGSAGTTVGTYTILGAKKTVIPFPPLSEQTAIAEVLSDMDSELAALKQRRDKTRYLKLGMMQELLTGRIRLI
jgi:type I restriction enzyme, S subunit